ncbi:DUF1194 domain-containing protein [Pseudohoeflea coraliihabitans]|uniref:DUF1194 domain-containing protein n=1 Tax=Pseudohoeflea coraliihabitans TaxID=2860393 RepID=A0ABS6WJ17_9HYPH|nr:DUF1194 domain-containing protein [Pseudohoeflea sp. DP4N28-3]MBW3095780.1 DUF1194 domain-containing protein [Pseudohoeflea sp. DP4N28-3]
MNWFWYLACRLIKPGVVLAAALVPVPMAAAEDPAEPVDVALVLAVDVSRSMSNEELRLQRQGYAEAIRSPEVLAAVRQGAHQRIAIAMFAWAADFSQQEIFSWRVLETREDAESLADLILASASIPRSRTSISGALQHGVMLLEASPHPALRKVIDVSGDGPNNQGDPVLSARQAALDRGIVINGLPLMTRGGPYTSFDIANLDAYYHDCVIGGPGSFLVPVTSWTQFPVAVRRKLVQEIGGTSPGKRPVQLARDDGDGVDCELGEKRWQQRQWMFDGQ